jgi:rare lipoprotein A (peptidoglycan hydrolase)
LIFYPLRNSEMKLIFGIVLGVLGLLPATCFGQVEEGKASYYADKFKGRHTSNGERYHPDSLTCAHRTFPFGTLLRISSAQRGTSVIVRVNDRGPFGKGRVVDLSRAAAEKLGIVLAGVADVTVQIVLPEPPTPLFPTVQTLEPLACRKVVIAHELHVPIPLTYSQPPMPAANAHLTDANGKGKSMRRTKRR